MDTDYPDLLEERRLRAQRTAAKPRAKSLTWAGDAVCLLLIASAGVLLVMRAWQRSVDPIIDFGRELYTPAQLAQGKHLYSDIAAFYGPLSQYFNAAMFRWLGGGLATLMALDAVILALGTTLLYWLLRSVAGRLAATVACLMFLALFATAHVGAVGNFNFLTPYSHEATHGFVLSLAALYCFAFYVRTGKMHWARAVGFFTGLVFLTKPEIFLALAGAVVVGMTFVVMTRPQNQPGNPIVAVVWWMATPVLAMFAFFATQSPWQEALRGTAGGWVFLSNPMLMHSHFYANSMGLEAPRAQAMLSLTTTARFTAMLLPALVAGVLIKGAGRWRRALAIAAGTLSAVFIALLEGLQWWAAAGESLMLVTLVLAAAQVIGLLRRQLSAEAFRQQVLRLTLVTFALLMLLKMFLHTRFHQYGFVLAAMATMVLALAILDWIPAFLESHKCSGWAFRAAGLTVLAMLTFVNLTMSRQGLADKTQPVGSGENQFLTDDRAPVFNDMIAYIHRNTSPEQTLTVLPEGVMLNVLTDRRTPIRYLSTIPSDLTMFGENQILASLANNRPDYIAILDRPTADLGQARFGIDYAQKICQWTRANYQPVHQSGAIPFTSDDFGILLLKRKAAETPAPLAAGPAR